MDNSIIRTIGFVSIVTSYSLLTDQHTHPWLSQIHLTICTNTFNNLDKYIHKFGQIPLDKYCVHSNIIFNNNRSSAYTHLIVSTIIGDSCGYFTSNATFHHRVMSTYSLLKSQTEINNKYVFLICPFVLFQQQNV